MFQRVKEKCNDKDSTDRISQLIEAIKMELQHPLRLKMPLIVYLLCFLA